MLINKDHLLHQLDGRPEDGWMSIKAVRSMIEDAPTIDAVPTDNPSMSEIEQRKIGEWDMFQLITSAYYGKQYYFMQENGVVYSRKTGKYMTVDDAIREFVNYIGWDGE